MAGDCVLACTTVFWEGTATGNDDCRMVGSGASAEGNEVKEGERVPVCPKASDKDFPSSEF